MNFFKSKKQKLGFTLIEMLMVTVVIGLLSGLIIINNRTAVNQAVNTKAKAFATGVPVTLAGNYLGEWKLDQINTPSTNKTPSSWGAYDGTLSGTTLPTLQTTSCVYDNCLYFDGNGYVNIGNDTNLQLTKGTIEAWIKTSNPGASYRGIVVKQSAYGLFLNDSIMGIYDWGASTWQTSSINLADGTWHHLAFVFNSGVSSGTSVYLDGILKLTTTMTVSNQTKDLNIGTGQSAPTLDQLFVGYIDNVRLYSDTLQVSQIKEHYMVGLSGLLAKGDINQSEYTKHLNTLNNNLAQN